MATLIKVYMDGRGGAVKCADRYRQCAVHLEKHLGQVVGADVRQRHVDAYEQSRTSEGAAPKTIKHELCFLRTCLRSAWFNDLLPSPPRYVVRIKTSPRTRVASAAEVDQVIAISDMALRRAIDFAWSTGMRQGGIRSARWSWVNHSKREITIPSEFTKNGQEHVAPIPPLLWELLQDEPRHPEYLFCRLRRGRNGKGKPEAVAWTKSTIGKAWRKARVAAGLHDLRFHDLRRSLASIAQERGHSAAAVRAVGGWLDPTVMQRHYSHASEQARRDVASDMESLLVLSPAGQDPPVLAPDAVALLNSHGWPGNVRELRNVIERSLAFAPLPPCSAPGSCASPPEAAPRPPSPAPDPSRRAAGGQRKIARAYFFGLTLIF